MIFLLDTKEITIPDTFAEGIDFEIQKSNIRKKASDYIRRKFNILTDYIREDDLEALKYIENLYMHIIFNLKLAKGDRSFKVLLDIFESDITAGLVDQYIVTLVLNFLEADTLNYCKQGEVFYYKEAYIELGRIRRMQVDYIKEDAFINAKSKPSKIKEYIDRYVIGQEAAKMALSTAVYNHMKRIRNANLAFPTDVVLLIGPSGCGKTEIMRRIRDITQLPMVFTDISSLGVSQTKGRHKEDILVSLINEAKGDIAEAQHGIVFMDEFDKILVPAISSEGDNVHDRVQAQLLTMLEGSDVEIKYRGNDITFNTSNILFVLAGAFDGIEEFIKSRKLKDSGQNVGIGFTAMSGKDMDLSIIKENISHKLLIDYGMKKELAGRLEDIAVMEKLTRDDYIRILKESEDNAIAKYSREIKLNCNANLEFTDGAIEAIVDNVEQMKTGARAINMELRRIMRELLYKSPSLKGIDKIIITEEYVKGNEEGLKVESL